MSEFATLIGVIAAGVLAYQQARASGEWSWPWFGWTLLLTVAYAGLSVLAGFALDALIGATDPLLRTLCIVAPIAAGAVPLALIANAIRRRYARRGSKP
jgi:hypothetical protein